MDMFEKFIAKTVTFIEKYLNENNIRNIVIGVSGGVDSAVSLSILKKIKNVNIFAYFIDISSSKESLEDAKLICEKNNLKLNIINLNDSFKSLIKELRIEDSLLRSGNVISRLRMMTLYDCAMRHKGIVVGNSNFDELYIGYYTKFGDSAVDMMILNNVIKKDVYNLAKILDVPEKIILKKPTADLHKNQYDEDEIGFSYNELDNYLLGNKIDSSVAKKINDLNRNNKHKRNIVLNKNYISKIRK